MDEHAGRLPTRKWIAAQVTGTAAFMTAWVSAGGWNSTLSIALIGLFAQAAISYVLPNADTPGGVPMKHDALATNGV